MPKTLTALTLFSGLGLAEVGLKKAGFKVVGAVEKAPDIAEWHQSNHPECETMIGSVSEFDYRKFSDIDLLHMSPPCQQYSRARNPNLPRHEGADAGLLALKAIDQTFPNFITLENVPGYLKADAYLQIKQYLWNLGYWLNEEILDAYDYGIPQTRRRLISRWIREDVLSRDEVPISHTAEDLLGGKYWYSPFPKKQPTKKGWYSAIADLLPSLPETELARWQIEKLPKEISSHLLIGGQNGSIRTSEKPAFTVCTGGPPRALLIYRDGNRGEKLRIFFPNQPSPTVKAMGHDRHYRQLDGWDSEEQRIVQITPLALARLQTVPDSFRLPKNSILACRGVGNGVPCELMHQIAASLITENSVNLSAQMHREIPSMEEPPRSVFKEHPSTIYWATSEPNVEIKKAAKLSPAKITRPAARWSGGKWILGKWIVEHLPSHNIYVEPFSGMWSVGLQKQPSETEVYNDLHSGAVNFWLTLRDRWKELIELIESTKFSSSLMQGASEDGGSPLKQALKFYAQSTLSYTGGGVKWPGRSSIRLQQSESEKHDHLWAIAERIKNLKIFNENAFDIIKRFDGPDTLFYCDPCYLPSTRNSSQCYVYDMTFNQHQQLAELLNNVQGSVVLSGYLSELYEHLYQGWRQIEKDTASNTTHKKAIECLWIKPKDPVLLPEPTKSQFVGPPSEALGAYEELVKLANQPIAKQMSLDLGFPELDEEDSWDTDCWRTPNNPKQPILDLVAQALGGTIGLDPTADNLRRVQAQRHFTKADNCFIQNWSSPAGTVFMNMPYSNPVPFLEKLVEQINCGNVREAIALMPTSSLQGIACSEVIEKIAIGTCMWTKSRVAFLGKDGTPKNGANFACAFVYFGDNWERFARVFRPWGWVFRSEAEEPTVKAVEVLTPELQSSDLTESSVAISRTMKPIFIPLKSQYFEDFKNGRKQIEYRRAGVGQFTLAKCTPGREVTLSKGYSKSNRITGTVVRSWIEHHEHPTGAIAKCYGTEPIDIIAISIRVDRTSSVFRCSDNGTARSWVRYLARTKLLGKCQVVRHGVALVIQGLTSIQRRLLDCITWEATPTVETLDRARQLADIPVIIQPVIPGLESWVGPKETWAT